MTCCHFGHFLPCHLESCFTCGESHHVRKFKNNREPYYVFSGPMELDNLLCLTLQVESTICGGHSKVREHNLYKSFALWNYRSLLNIITDGYQLYLVSFCNEFEPKSLHMA